MFYHLRVSLTSRDHAQQLIDNYLSVFPLYAYLFCFESKDDNLHIHGHIQYEQDYDASLNKNKVKRSEFFKKMKGLNLVPDKNESNYHEQVKDELKNLAYVMKDNDLITMHNISEEKLEEARLRVDNITNEQRLTMKEQLYNAWSLKERLFVDKLEAYIFIDQYHVERDYLPPNMTNKNQYALYIVYKLSSVNRWPITEETGKLIASFNGIREEDYARSLSASSHVQYYDNLVKAKKLALLEEVLDPST